MSDLIDRQEAIKALTMFGAEHNAIAVIRGCPSRGKASDGDDLIYRQAAIDAITEYGSGDTIYMSVVELKRRIEHLPSAQPEHLVKESGGLVKDLVNDTISRQAAIDELYKMLHDCFWADDEELDAVITTLNELPSVQSETCEGCKHLGKWENEVEYGYPSPCTRCKRRVGDHYER